MATATIYPALDGHIGSGSNTSWAIAVAASTAWDSSHVDYTTTARPLLGWEANNAGDAAQWFIHRGFLGFDTSSLPVGAVITAATIKVWVTSKYSVSAGSAALVAGTPASNTALVEGDFDQVGSTEFTASRTLYSALTTGAYNTFTLNAAGLAHISKTGYTHFAFRPGRDLDNSSPTINQYSGGYIDTSEFTGTSHDPYLEVTYSDADISIAAVPLAVAVSAPAPAVSPSPGSADTTVTAVPLAVAVTAPITGLAIAALVTLDSQSGVSAALVAPGVSVNMPTSPALAVGVALLPPSVTTTIGGGSASITSPALAVAVTLPAPTVTATAGATIVSPALAVSVTLPSPVIVTTIGIVNIAVPPLAVSVTLAAPNSTAETGYRWFRTRRSSMSTATKTYVEVLPKGTTKTSSYTSPTYTAKTEAGILVVLDVTAASGTGGLTVRINAHDQASSQTVALNAAPTAVTATGTTSYALYPFGAIAGNVTQATSFYLPRMFSITVTAADSSSYTYSVGYCLLP